MVKSNYVPFFQAVLMQEYGADEFNKISAMQSGRGLFLKWQLYVAKNAPAQVYKDDENGNRGFISKGCPKQAFLNSHMQRITRRSNDIFSNLGNLDCPPIQGIKHSSGEVIMLAPEFLRLAQSAELEFRHRYKPANASRYSNCVMRKTPKCGRSMCMCIELHSSLLVDYLAVAKISSTGERIIKRRRSKYDWKAIFDVFHELQLEHGGLSLDDPDWRSYPQASKCIVAIMQGKNYAEKAIPDEKYITSELKKRFGELD